MTRDPSEVRYQYFQLELAEERAAALGRAGRRLESSLARCAQLLAKLDVIGPILPATQEALLVEYREARADSERLRRDYCIQREALGLHDLRCVDEHYPRPPRR